MAPKPRPAYKGTSGPVAERNTPVAERAEVPADVPMTIVGQETEENSGETKIGQEKGGKTQRKVDDNNIDYVNQPEAETEHKQAKKPAAKKSKKGKKTKKANVGIAVNVKAAKIDAGKVRKDEVKKDKRAAFLGYVRIDLFKQTPRIVFGEWNERGMSVKLVNSYQTGSIQRFDEKNMIMILVHAQCLIPTKYVRTLENEEGLPMLGDIFEDGCAPTVVKPCGGQHRSAALHIMQTRNTKRLAELGQEGKKIQADLKDLEDGDAMQEDEGASSSEVTQRTAEEEKARLDIRKEAQKKLERIQERLMVIKRDLRLGGLWLAAVYDIAKLTESDLHQMSWNESNFVYMETKNEWAFGYLRRVHSLWSTLQYQPKTTALIEQGLRKDLAEMEDSPTGKFEREVMTGAEQARAKGVATQNIFKLPFAREMIMRLLSYGPYFCQQKN
ncbi:hypothetical protein PHLCEN_2v7163 [Hermanssonia centrifuga]|uniref:Uncharacterized protein n=1 Tax=Hermanssonia centrifuga TaxID=98765 RepID=A0A2R6NXB1_9APHY|nr:hypothetical protein PHLCEN_2v7163 [Hermanssonia centrifuga]